jgi:hypothetical protein
MADENLGQTEEERIARLPFQMKAHEIVGDLLRAERAYKREPSLAANMVLIRECEKIVAMLGDYLYEHRDG